MIKGAINKLGQYMSETFDFNKVTFLLIVFLYYYYTCFYRLR